MHNEMTGGIKIEISLNGQALTILGGMKGQHSPSAVNRGTKQTVKMNPNSCRGAHQGANSCFVSTKIGCSVLKGSNKGTPKYLGTG